MSTSDLLPGIAQHNVKMPRLNMAYLEAGTGDIPIVLVHGNCSSSLFFQDLMPALVATGRYTAYAPDMRGYGDSETLPVDATRGVGDFSEIYPPQPMVSQTRLVLDNYQSNGGQYSEGRPGRLWALISY